MTFLPISDNPPSFTISQWLASWNTYHDNYHKQTSSIFQGKEPYLLWQYVFLNHLISIKLLYKYYDMSLPVLGLTDEHFEYVLLTAFSP